MKKWLFLVIFLITSCVKTEYVYKTVYPDLPIVSSPNIKCL